MTGAGDRSRPRAALPALCATRITSRGIVSYAFVLNPQTTAATGRSPTATTAALAPFAGAALAGALGGCPGVSAVLALVSAGAALFTLGGSPSHCSAVPVQAGVVHE